jgi:hypothetical protein
MVLYGIFIFIAVVSIILSGLGYLKRIWKFRGVLHVFWTILAILTFLGFIIVVILGVLSVGTMEVCLYMDGIFNDIAEF